MKMGQIVPTRPCAVPGCDARLSSQNVSGVCRDHNHAPTHCRCPKCHRRAAAEADRLPVPVPASRTWNAPDVDCDRGPVVDPADLDPARCRALFAAMLRQSIDDLFSRRAKAHSSDFNESRAFIRSVRFDQACVFVGLDPDWVRELLQAKWADRWADTLGPRL